MKVMVLLYKAFWLLSSVHYVTSAHLAQETFLITAPPSALQTPTCEHAKNGKRQESCQYGQCGTACLEQGAFCCGPAGSLATAPLWVCDNGACITSVRGTSGIVDCYDPDNPSGTTQSCIDNQPTASCNPTDRCYTCEADEPYCRWETYIASNEPELRWFSCVETKIADLTLYAGTITDIQVSTTVSASPSGTISQVADDNRFGLSTGAIIGIAVGVGVAVLASVAGFAYWYFAKRKSRPPPAPAPPQELDPDANRDGLALAFPIELSSPYTSPRQDQTRVELQAQKWDRTTRQPVELEGESRPQNINEKGSHRRITTRKIG